MNNEPMDLAGVLLPCPFCGTRAEFRDWGRGDKGVGCANMGCIVSVMCRTNSVEVWNRRAPLAERTEQPVAFRFLSQIARGVYAWSRWQEMSDLEHYSDTDGALVKGPHPDWKQIEYAYAHPSGLIAALRGLSKVWRERVADSYMTGDPVIDARTEHHVGAHLGCADELDRILAAHEGKES